MKKIVALLAVLFSVVVPVQSQAAPGEKVVIIDSYFDKSKITGLVEFVCLANDKCVNTASPKPGLGSDAVNHGTVMANVARQQNATATLVLIQTEEVTFNKKTGAFSVSTLNGSDFIKALTWVNTNKSSVSAVSFSYNLTMTSAKIGECKVSTVPGVANAKTDSEIRSLVASLKSAGIPVLAAAGNFNNKPLQYPACLTDVISVGSTGQPGYHQTNVKVLATIINSVDNTSSMTTVSPWLGTVDFNTSAATVAVASNWKSIPAQNNKVNILYN